MNGIGGEDFYDSLFEEDTDAAKLSVIPGEKKRLEKSVAIVSVHRPLAGH